MSCGSVVIIFTCETAMSHLMGSAHTGVGNDAPHPCARASDRSDFYRRPVFGCVGPSLLPPSRLTCVPMIVPLFLSIDFQLVDGGGGGRLRRKPATARKHPIPNEGYQACISNAKAMKGLPSRPAFPARRSLPRAPFPRFEPLLVRTLSFRTPVRALFPRSEALPARRTFVPKPCPCTDRSIGSLTRALCRRSFAPNLCPCAVASFLGSEPLPVRCSLVPHPCPCPAPSLSIAAPLLSLALAVPLSRYLSPCRSLAISPRAALSLSLAVPLSRRDTSSLSAK